MSYYRVGGDRARAALGVVADRTIPGPASALIVTSFEMAVVGPPPGAGVQYRARRRHYRGLSKTL